jgi:TPP-dependent pyruvate/acetoin dehydrogenase alpha subunit
MTDSLPDNLHVKRMLSLYRTMVLIRHFEIRVNELYMAGRIPSTLHLYMGQEAVATGVCAALQQDDYVLSTHRPHGHALAKGLAPRALMAELYGKATGCCKAKGGSMHVGDISIGMIPAIAIVGANVPIAAGVALAAKRLGNGRVAACFFGDGAANEGAWHEGLNLASIWRLPVLYVCENNLYAASTPFSTAFAIANVADRASAYGMPGVVVDGNDVLAVYEVAAAAVDRARSGDGPTLIECKTYRICGHSRSDPRTYRTRDEEAAWLALEPLGRYRQWLLAQGLYSELQLDEVVQDVDGTIEEAITFAEAGSVPELAELWADVFAPGEG